MKTTLDLPDELIREVKLRAVVQGRTVKDLVAEFLRHGLGLTPPTRPDAPEADSLVEIGPQGLPLIRCRKDAPSTRMSVKKLLNLERAAQVAEDIERAGKPV